MAAREGRKQRPPLDSARLDELALRYVGRFATTRSKLASYLHRKLRERGWSEPRPADVDGLVERLVRLGYVDDAAFALSKSRSLTARGYGERRVEQSLRVAGIDAADSSAARDHARSEAVEAALHFARRRRFGPFAASMADRPEREKAIAAMVRAGHPFGLARLLVDMRPGEQPDVTELSLQYRTDPG